MNVQAIKISPRFFFGVGLLILSAAFLLPRTTEAAVCLRQTGGCRDFATVQEANDAGAADAGLSGFTTFCGACTEVVGCPGSTATANPPTDVNGECAVTPAGAAELTPIRGGPVIGFTNPICKPGQSCSPQIIIGNIVRAALGIVGSIALLMFIIGGFIWMLAGGNTEKVKKSRDIMIWAGLGLLVIFAAYMIINFIINTFAS